MTDKFLDQEVKFEENTDGLVIERYQAIPDTFVQNLKDIRDYNKAHKANDYHCVASIPVAVWEKWKREGKDPDNQKIATLVSWLKAEGLDYFITSDKV